MQSSQSAHSSQVKMLQPKKNNAPAIWFSIVLTVLMILFVETRGTGRRNTNFFVNGDSDSVGAEIFLNGTHIGRINIANNSGLSGGTFSCHLKNGSHNLEVRKPGFKTLSRVLEFNGQDYLGVNLEPLEGSNGL